MATRSRKSTNDYGVGEFRSGPVAGTAMLDGLTFRRKPVLFSEVDGLAIVEGDIVIGAAEDVRRSADSGALESVGRAGAQFRWPDATVPFTIDGGLPNQSRVTDAVSHWESNTRIRLVPRDPSRHSNWVNFVSGDGCSSPVGMQGGQQNITLGSGCSTGNAIHEIGHSLGLWHEQSREDRDTFVQIVFANIDPTKTHNFTQHITDGDDLGGYDYGSLMHYPPDAFSINGQPTIIALQPLPAGVVLGQRSGLSAGDIAGIHSMYPGGAITIKEVLKEGVSDPVLTQKELAKDPIDDPVLTRKELAKDPTEDPVFTRKEGVSDPVWTRKEFIKEPIKDPTTEPIVVKPFPFNRPFPDRTGITPIPIPRPDPQFAATFVTGAPSRVPPPNTELVQELLAQIQYLAGALADIEQQRQAIEQQYQAIQQQYQALAGAYDQALALLAQLQAQGQG